MGRALDACEWRQNSKKKHNTKLDGVRRVGRPKMRWKDGVDERYYENIRGQELEEGRPRQRRMGKAS